MPFLQGKAEFTELFPLPTKYCTQGLKVSPKGSILMSVRAPVGNVNLADRKYVIGRGLTSISLKEGNNRFLFYSLLHNKKVFEAQSYGSTFKAINKTTITDFRMPLPSLPEQRAIASVLGAIQEAKFARQKEIALERERKAALMDYLFSHGTKGEPCKQTEIGEIPESWELAELANVLRYIGNGLTNKQNKVGNGYPVTRIETISDDYINTAKVGYIDTLPQTIIKKYRLYYGDMLVSHINSDPQLGRSVIYEGNPELLLHGMNLLRLQADSTTLDPFFLNFIFGCYRNRGVFIAIASRAVGQSSINQGRMKSLIVPLPKLSQQQEIAEILRACDDKITALEQETARLDELFHAMLEELMTGKRSAIPLIDAEFPN